MNKKVTSKVVSEGKIVYFVDDSAVFIWKKARLISIFRWASTLIILESMALKSSFESCSAVWTRKMPTPPSGFVVSCADILMLWKQNTTASANRGGIKDLPLVQLVQRSYSPKFYYSWRLFVFQLFGKPDAIWNLKFLDKNFFRNLNFWTSKN